MLFHSQKSSRLSAAAVFIIVAVATATADDKSRFFHFNRLVFVAVLKWYKSYIPLTLIQIKSQLKMSAKLIIQNTFTH